MHLGGYGQPSKALYYKVETKDSKGFNLYEHANKIDYYLSVSIIKRGIIEQ